MNSIRKIWALTLIILITIPVFAPAYASSSVPVVTIDGKSVFYKISLGYPFIDENNRTQVPFRSTLESFGAKVTWDNVHYMAIAEKAGIIVKIPIGTDYIIKNGKKIQIDTQSLIRRGQTYLPIRAVLEAFGAKVTYVASTRTITVKTTLGEAERKLMKIRFMDVGQGDSLFIDFGRFEILIDAGTSSYGSQIASKIKPFVEGSLDIVIATHAHADHIGGLPAVINAFQVSTIIDSGEVATTQAYKNYYAAAKGEANCDFITDSSRQFEMGSGAIFKILEMGDDGEGTNSNSVVCLMDYRDVELLMMGDLDSVVEEQNLSAFSDVDVIKIGNHGAKTSTSEAFLKKVKPEIAIISAGIENTYHYPQVDLMKRLLDRKMSVYGSFRSGDITVTTDGLTYSIDAEPKLTLFDSGAPADH
jgi:beta-lactamase superfamily II metal-dependent hydrolase